MRSFQDFDFPVLIQYGMDDKLARTATIKPAHGKMETFNDMILFNALIDESINIPSHDLAEYIPWANLRKYVELSASNRRLQSAASFEAFLDEVLIRGIETSMTSDLQPIPKGNASRALNNFLSAKVMSDDDILSFTNVYKSPLDSYKCFDTISVCAAIAMHYFRHNIRIIRCCDCGRYFAARHGNEKRCSLPGNNGTTCKQNSKDDSTAKAQSADRYKIRKTVRDRLTMRLKYAKERNYPGYIVRQVESDIDEFNEGYKDRKIDGNEIELLRYLREWEQRTSKKG